MFFLLPNQIQLLQDINSLELASELHQLASALLTSDAWSCTPIISLRPPSSMVVLHSMRGRMASCSVGGGMASSFVFAIPSGGI